MAWGGGAAVSEEAALDIVRRNLLLQVAAKLYGRSVEMIPGRINVTAARVRIKRPR